ncbi:unnamed protein product [Camellia sinensis]
MDVPKDQISTLLDHGLYTSAQFLACFLVSSSTVNAETSPHVKAENLVLLADALFREREFRRAIHTYKQALQHCKIVPKQSTMTRNSLPTSNRSSSPNSFNNLGINENEVKFKIASCHYSLNENRAALVEYGGNSQQSKKSANESNDGQALSKFETHSFFHCLLQRVFESCTGIPKRSARRIVLRILETAGSSSSCFLLSSLLSFRAVEFAVASVTEIFDSPPAVVSELVSEWHYIGEGLGSRCSVVEVVGEVGASGDGRHCPYVIEAIIALAELGVASKDIISLFPQTPNRSGRPPFDHFDSSRWLHRYVEAQCCIVSNDYKGGLELFTELLQRFPNNIHILLEMAKVEAIIGKRSAAITNFEKVRSIDPYIVTYMDEYAMLLKIKSEHSKLHKLVHDLLNTDPTRPEAFVALSVLWERKDERGALSYAEKSIRIDERHIPGYIMKGNLFLSMNQPQAAVVAFRGAQELRPDLRSYQGLVHSYLALSKIKEALHAAREAMKAMPQSAKALKLVGDVHASNSGGREKAKKFYESALRLEPGYLGAASALAELHVIEGRNGDAVSLLERYLKDWADDSLHIKLAQVFAATNMLQDALSHYQAALRINPQNEAAKKGLERLEKQMKGVDPDAPEEDEENEVEDADGDQIETELL